MSNRRNNNHTRESTGGGPAWPSIATPYEQYLNALVGPQSYRTPHAREIIKQWKARPAAQRKVMILRNGKCEAIALRGQHDWRWTCWPLTDNHCLERWCDVCNLKQLRVDGQWVPQPPADIPPEVAP